MQMWNNPSCSKCAAARATLDEAGVVYEVRAYLDEPPTEAEFREVLARLDAQPWDVCRTGEPIAAQLGIADWPRGGEHADRWIVAMVQHPELIQRPILLLDDGGAAVGRSPWALGSVLRRLLSRQQISGAVGGLGWRYVCGVVRTAVRVESLAEAADIATRAVEACGDAGDHLQLDLRRDRVVLTLLSPASAVVTPVDIDLAGRIAAAVEAAGRSTDPDVGVDAPRSVQVLEIAIDALDIASIRPFWKAVMGYRDPADASGSEDALEDPFGQGPAIWFQQMDAPRPQRNRIHIDVSVPHDEAPLRLRSALAAGGTLLSEASAPAFWVLADAEGNEACISTWQGRDDTGDEK